jgi:hypothetical protein
LPSALLVQERKGSHMSWLSDFVSAHGDTLLYASLSAALGWIGTQMAGKPILALREKREEALRVADRYAYIGWGSSEELVRTGRRALFDVASSLRAMSRARGWALDLYCRCLEIDLEMASTALDGLGGIVGGPHDNVARGMTANGVF